MMCNCADKTPQIRAFGDWTAATAATRTIDVRHAVSVEIGGGSQLDAVYVTPQNGQKYLVAVGAPLPEGDWRGPFLVEPYRTATAPPAAGFATRLELVFKHGCGDPGAARGADVQEHNALDPAVALATLVDIPIPGRDEITLAMLANAQILTFAIDLVWYGAIEKSKQVYPATGTDTLAAAATFARTFQGDHASALRIRASQPAGGTVDTSWEAK